MSSDVQIAYCLPQFSCEHVATAKESLDQSSGIRVPSLCAMCMLKAQCQERTYMFLDNRIFQDEVAPVCTYPSRNVLNDSLLCVCSTWAPSPRLPHTSTESTPATTAGTQLVCPPTPRPLPGLPFSLLKALPEQAAQFASFAELHLAAHVLIAMFGSCLQSCIYPVL